MILVICVREAPARIPRVVAFRIWFDDGDVDQVGEAGKMSYKVGAVCKWAEEADIEVIAVGCWWEGPRFADLAVEAVCSPWLMP